MTREIITIAAGQCGNQLNYSFWEKLCLEHGIEPDGTLNPDKQVMDRKDVFFYQSDDCRYVPRSVLLDLEPRVVDTVLSSKFGGLFNPENVYTPPNGGSGAGNIWGLGYSSGEEVLDQIMDILDREAENSDSLEGFTLSHAVAGGTGSGLGSLMLENVSDRFPKKILQTFSLFPDQTSDVVVQPYNTVLTLKRLIENADSVLMFENTALLRIAAEIFSQNRRISNSSLTMSQVNELVSTTLATYTASIRFPGYLYTNLTSILSTLVPVPDYHFIIPTFSPFLPPNPNPGVRRIRKTSINEIQRRLIQSKYAMVAISPTALQRSKYLTLLQVLRGDIDSNEYRKQLLNHGERDEIEFCKDYFPASLISVAKWSPFHVPETKLCGLGLLNNTSIVEPFQKTLASFEKLYNRGAFLSEYRKQYMFADNLDEFEVSKEAVKSTIDSYALLETPPLD